MIELQDFQANADKVRDVLKVEFAFAHRLYESWMYVRKTEYVQASPLDHIAVNLAMTLNVQACRHFRSVISLGELGEAPDALIITRSLYETAVALLFVLKPDVRLRAVPVKNRTDAWRAEISDQPADALSIRKRAGLYLASMAFNDEDRHDRFSKRPELDQLAQNVKPDPQIIAHCESEVGKEWAYILRNRPRTYSGLHLSELVKLLGENVDLYHETLYHYLSRMSHAADAIRHSQSINGQVAPRWFSDSEEIKGALHAGTQAFLVCALILQNHLGFGPDTDKLLDGFIEEFKTGF